jgi:type IV secretory pathway TraG/TraD family ATPase VirD4
MRKKQKMDGTVVPDDPPSPYPTDIPGRPWRGLNVGNGRSADGSTTSPISAGPEASVLVVGPPRSGKTSGLVIPNVLNAPGAVVSTSTKPDVFEFSMYRRWVLGNVFVFDPTGTIEIPDGAYPLRWSPVVGCDSFDAAVAMAHALGSAARPGSVFTESAHWVERAESLLAPLLFAANQRGADMAAVCRWVLGRDVREPQAALEDSGHQMAQSVLAGIVNTDERERSGIFSTTSGLLAAYRTEAALATTRDVNFDPARFVRSTDALYICAPAHAQEQLAPLVVALLEQIRSAVYARPKNAAPVVFVLDEVAAIAPLPSLPALAAEGGGQGLVTMACLQDLSQARARWGEEAEGFFSIFNTKVIFPGIGDYRTLQLISSLAGEQQVPVTSVNRWAGEWGRIRHSVSVAPQFRPRLPIDQVARGVPGHTLNLSAAGMHSAAHVPWFEHPQWAPLIEYGRALYGERTRPGVPTWHPDRQ